jgi:ribosomal protein L34E
VAYCTGGKYACQYLSKNRKGALCGDCHVPLPGVSHAGVLLLVAVMLAFQIPHMDSRGFKNAKHHDKTVSRAYGGAKCHACVRQRLVFM